MKFTIKVVRVGGIKSQPFTVGVWLQQACVLSGPSPLLFIIYISEVTNWGVATPWCVVLRLQRGLQANV